MNAQSKSYWSFLRQSKGRHGLHSPFVFQLVDQGLTQKVDKNFAKERKIWLNALKKDKETFEIIDLGVGSKKMSNRRSVAQLAKTASSNGIYGDLIWKLCRYFKPQAVLELGTSIGTGTIHIKNACPTAHVYTIEGCDRTLSKACQQFDYWKLDGITTICADFQYFLSLPPMQVYDMVFLDGNHNGEATLEYIEQLFSQTHNETLFIMDDIRWSEDMWKAWQSICEDQRFHVTIDMGRMGLFWKRTQQTKEHFVQRPVVFKTKFF
ncbi:MAG: class I SAM-dependent methyltransferase [Fluviicola sp.]|nr:class I SAM-dependent methyltransferase [Fluviicola sp.]